MSSASGERRRWQCPGCGRSYRIPPNAEEPRRCPDCESRAPCDPQPAITAPKAMTFRPKPQVKPPKETRVESSPQPSDQIEELRSEIAEILPHLRNISRTMTMIRRMMWFFVAISALSALSLGYYMLTAKKQTESIFQILEQRQQVQPGQRGQFDLEELLDMLK